MIYLNIIFKEVPNTGQNDSTLLPRDRHLVHADIELSYWKMIAGTTISYYSDPETVVLFSWLRGYYPQTRMLWTITLRKHTHGDVVADVGKGYKHNEHFYFGFIIKNVANRFYELRRDLLNRKEIIRSNSGIVSSCPICLPPAAMGNYCGPQGCAPVPFGYRVASVI